MHHASIGLPLVSGHVSLPCPETHTRAVFEWVPGFSGHVHNEANASTTSAHFVRTVQVRLAEPLIAPPWLYSRGGRARPDCGQCMRSFVKPLRTWADATAVSQPLCSPRNSVVQNKEYYASALHLCLSGASSPACCFSLIYTVGACRVRSCIAWTRGRKHSHSFSFIERI